MSWIAVGITGVAVGGLAGGAGAYFGGQAEADAASKAAAAQEGAANDAAQIQANAIGQASQAQQKYDQQALDLYRQQYAQQQANLQPYMQAGQNALTQANNIAQNYQPFDLSKAQLDPGYSFRLKQGLDAIQNSAAANGGMFSGNTMKAMNDYAGNSASQEYQNAFNRYQVERQARLDPLFQIAGMGQNAAFGANQASQGYMGAAGGALTGTGQDLAQGAEGVGNAYAQGRLGAGNAYAQGIYGVGNATASMYGGIANSLDNAISSGANFINGSRMLNALTARNNGQKFTGPWAPAYYGGQPYTTAPYMPAGPGYATDNYAG